MTEPTKTNGHPTPTPFPLTIVDIGLHIPEPTKPRPEDARIPDHIPNIRHCDYLTGLCNPSGEFTSTADGHALADDELAAMVWNHQSERLHGCFVPVPLTHMAYNQALREQAEVMREAGMVGVEVYRETARITGNGRTFAVRLAWLHSPGPDGEGFGSNNWTPEKGAESDKCRREFDELNKDNPNWPGW
jgi:hypothetical protein